MHACLAHAQFFADDFETDLFLRQEPCCDCITILRECSIYYSIVDSEHLANLRLRLATFRKHLDRCMQLVVNRCSRIAGWNVFHWSFPRALKKGACGGLSTR